MNLVSRVASSTMLFVGSALLAGCSAADGFELEGQGEPALGAAQAALTVPAPLVLQPVGAAVKYALFNNYSSSSNIGCLVVLSACACTVSGAPTIQRGLLSFDLSSIAAGSDIESATLRFLAELVTPLYGQGIHYGL